MHAAKYTPALLAFVAALSFATLAQASTYVVASPASGPAPLTVTFTPGPNIGTYAVSFGDGTSASLQQGAITHTYQSTGTFTATFESDAACFRATPPCAMPVQNYGSITIIVTGGSGSAESLSASPKSGSAPLIVTFSGKTPEPFQNYTIVFGDGSSKTVYALSDPGVAGGIVSATHTYASAGTYMASMDGQTVTITVTGSGGQCTAPALTQDLSLGATDESTGGEVSMLQTFLLQYYAGKQPSGLQSLSVTGFFGPITRAWVIQFQNDHNLPATGFVGPLTRVAIANACGGGSGGGNNGDLSASPASGAAPLTVGFTATVPAPAATFYNFWFGDGQSQAVYGFNFTCGTSTCGANVSHTYQTAGTYNAQLFTSDDQSIGSSTVTVSGAVPVPQPLILCPQGKHPNYQTNTCDPDSTGTLSASPTSGAAPLTVTFTSPSGGTISFGDGTSGELVQMGASGQKGCVNGSSLSCYSAIHTYAAAGTYTATVSGNGGSVTITVTGSPTHGTPPGTFTASPTSGSAPLTVNFYIPTSIATFGDGTSYACENLGCVVGSVSHTYSAPGTYTATAGGVSITITVAGPNGSGSSMLLSAAPTSGQVPLTVTFTMTNTPSAGWGLAFGDGSYWAPADGQAGPTFQTTHTYNTVGTYTAGLYEECVPVSLFCPKLPSPVIITVK